MKFKNPILNFERTDAQTGPKQYNMPLQLFQSWGHKKLFDYTLLSRGLFRPDFFYDLIYKPSYCNFLEI